MSEKKPQEQWTKRALTAPVPASQRCEICGKKRAPERHFLTVPVPVAFTRICDKDWTELKKKVREHPLMKQVIAELFNYAKQKAAT